MKLYWRRGVALVGALVVIGVFVSGGSAQKENRTVDTKRAGDATRHSEDAAKVFGDIMGAPDKGIPQDLLDRAEAVAVFPGVVKAAFIIGGQGGQGVISRRTASGWSSPAFFNLGGGSFGAQIGAEKTDYVLLIMNDGGLRGLLEDKFEMGGEVSAAAGPVGRTAAATTNATLDAGILTYSRSKGAFIGASLKGAAITPDNDLNQAIYGVKARDILGDLERVSQTQLPAGVDAFPKALGRYSSK